MATINLAPGVGAISLLIACAQPVMAATYFRQMSGEIGLNSSFQTILSVNVPSGNWVIDAKAIGGEGISNPTTVECDIVVNGTTVDKSQIGFTGSDQGETMMIVNMAAATVTTSSTIALACDTSLDGFLSGTTSLIVRPAESLK